MPPYNTPAPGAPYFLPPQIPAAGTLIQSNSTKAIPKLFRPLKIRGVEFHNRIFLSPMVSYSSTDGGDITEWHKAHLGGIIIKGPGLTFVEATAVTPEGRTASEDSGIWSDAHIPGLASIVEFAHSQNQKIGIQLAHAGRKASRHPQWVYEHAREVIGIDAGGWPDNVWGTSTEPHDSTDVHRPKALTKEGIIAVVQAFADAAQRAVKAGFDVIEIHNAHGYLLHEFLSPFSNKRTDDYGGSFENRIRFTLEVVDAIRAVIPVDMPLFLRISATDWLEESLPDEPSWRSEDTVKLAPLLAAHGVDLLDVSSGGINSAQKIKPGPAYQAFLAEAVKRVVGDQMFVAAVGGITDGHIAEKVLRDGQADVVLVGRKFLENPGTVLAFADDLDVEIAFSRHMAWPFVGRRGKPL